MEVIIDCAECGASELETRSDWAEEDEIYVYLGECKGCQILTRAEMIPHGASIKIFAVKVPEEPRVATKCNFEDAFGGPCVLEKGHEGSHSDEC